MLGRKFFDSSRAERIEEYGLEVWPGYATSVIIVPNNMLLQVDIAHRILRT
jgi:hypothetical protein